MDCIASPLSEDQLLAAISEIADEAVLEHLRQCPGCRARLNRLQQAENQMKQKSHRWNCPTVEKLSDFAFKLLDDDEQNRIGEHIKDCPACQLEIEGLWGFLERVEKAEKEEQRRISQRYAPGQRISERAVYPTIGAAAFALRGDVTHPLEFDGITLILSTFEDDETILLMGQLIGPEAAQWQNGLVKAQQGTAMAALSVVSDQGKFRCHLNNIVETVHLTIMSRQGKQLVVEAIDISSG